MAAETGALEEVSVEEKEALSERIWVVWESVDDFVSVGRRLQSIATGRGKNW